MTEAVRKKLENIPANYADTHLRHGYQKLLTSYEQHELPADLARCLGSIIRASNALSLDQRARLLYEALSRLLVYDTGASEGQRRFSYISCLREGKSVCMGISELYTLLGTAFGLKVQTIIGYAGDLEHDDGGLHAWNLVWLSDDDAPYHIDLTWDLDHQNAFKYYLKSDAFFEKTHTWLKNRYPSCPEDREAEKIPKIPQEAVDLVCRRLKQLRTK